jgi:dephospho-CoA kinase
VILKVFGVTGLPGSGKSIISRIAKKEGIYTISMGDVIREEAERRNITTGKAAVILRKKYGNNVVASRCVTKIKNHSKNRHNKRATVKKMYNSRTNHNKHPPKKYKKIEQDIYLIEGIRSPYEVAYFKKQFNNFKVIAIHSSPNERFNRLKRRKRNDDSPDYNKFVERDQRELNFGIGKVIALADYMLINEGPIPNFKNNVRALITNEIKPKRKNINRKRKSKNKNKSKQNRKYQKGKKQYNKHNNRKNHNKQNRR